MKIAIIGSGAMGCRFGVALARSGAEVVLCDVWKEHVDSINEFGLKVQNLNSTQYIKIPATTDIKSIGAVDAIVIFTKSMHTENAVTQALEIMQPDTPVFTFQNGLGNISVLERYVGRDRVVAGITNYPTDLLEPGAVRTDGTGYTKLQALGVHGRAACAEVCSLLVADGMNCQISDDIMKELWEKLAFNNAMNAITALTRQRVGHMGSSPYGFELCCLVAREVCDVAEAEGVNTDYDSVVATFRKVLDPNESGNHLTSMLQDVLKKKQTEIDSICGAVMEKAAQHGIKTPHLKTIFNLIHVIDENYGTQVII